MNVNVSLPAAVAALLFTSPALAQDAAATEAPAADTAPTTPVEAADGGTPVVSDANATAAEKSLEEDLNLFWGKRREVSVVQRRLVEKDGRLELSAAFSTIPNDDFIVYFPLGLRVGYHFSESFDVEASFAYAIQNPSDLTTFLKEDPAIALKEAQIQEKIDMFYNVSVLWAPIYGKVSVLGSKLTHFETYVGLGAGVFHTTTKDPANPDGNPEVKPSGNTVLGFRWFINDNINIRTDYRHYFFQKFGGGVSIPAEFSLGLGFLI